MLLTNTHTHTHARTRTQKALERAQVRPRVGGHRPQTADAAVTVVYFGDFDPK